MRKGSVNQFMQEIEDRIHDLGGSIESSAVIIDDEEDVIQADDVYLEDVESGCHGKDVKSAEDFYEDIDVEDTYVEDFDQESYHHDMYSRIEEELNELVDGISWDGDESNIYMDVSFSDGRIITFTIPKEDLIYDFENMDTDIQYICDAVREDVSDISEEVVDESYEEG